jgi:hypothetical protein
VVRFGLLAGQCDRNLVVQHREQSGQALVAAESQIETRAPEPKGSVFGLSARPVESV